MAFRRPSASNVSPVNPYASYPNPQNQPSQPSTIPPMQDDSAKRADPTAHPPPSDQFINDQDANDSAGDDDEDDEKPKSDKKTGRRKIKIEFIQDKSRRHITFSKRKAGPSFFPCFLVETTSTHPYSTCSGIMKKVSFLSQPFSLLSFSFSPVFLPLLFLPLGLRTFHPYRYTSTAACSLGNRFSLYLHHCQATAARHTAGGQESHPGLPQRPSWHPP